MSIELFTKKDPNGCLSVEKYIVKHHPTAYKNLIEYCILNNLHNIQFKEKVYCYIHQLNKVPTCQCGNFVKFKNKTLGYQEFCSNKCVSKSKAIRDKIKQTNLKRYGNENHMKSDVIYNRLLETLHNRTEEEQNEINEKRVKTVKERYGVNSVANVPEFIEKRVANFDSVGWRMNFETTMLERYGVKNILELDEYKKKMVENTDYDNKTKKTRNTMIERYGGWYTATSEFSEKYNNTMLEKYGEHFMKFDNDIKDKTNYNKNIVNIKRTEKTYNIKIINRQNINNMSKYIIYCDSCNTNYTTFNDLLTNRKKSQSIQCTNCNPIDRKISSFHLEIVNYIKSISNTELIMNDRTIIKPYEIDILLPEYKIGIECNGVYWHSCDKKEKEYHLTKHVSMIENGYRLIQIWDYDWKLKQDIIKNILYNVLNSNNETLENYLIKDVSKKEAKNFFNTNSLVSKIGEINVGLYKDDILYNLISINNNVIINKANNIYQPNNNGLYLLYEKYNLKIVKDIDYDQIEIGSQLAAKKETKIEPILKQKHQIWKWYTI